MITIQIETLQVPRCTTYLVTEVHDTGDGGLIAEFQTAAAALAFAQNYAAQFGCRLRTAEIIEFALRLGAA